MRFMNHLNHFIYQPLFASLLLLSMGGCGEKSAPSPQKSNAAAPAQQMAGEHLLSTVNGLQAEQVRSYLRNVEETKAKHLDLKWNPAVVKIDREAAIRSLKAISRNGANFVLDANEPALASLQKGSILFIWGVAIRKVTGIQTKGAYTLVQTQAAALTEALTDAKIDFVAPLSFKHAFISQRPKRKSQAVMQPAGFQPLGTSSHHGFLRVSDDPLPDANDNTNEDEQAEDVEQTPQSSFSGQVGGFDYEVAYTIAGTQLQFDLEARKAVGNMGADNVAKEVQKGSAVAPKDNKFASRLRAQTVNSAGTLAKGLFSQGYDDIDIRLKVKGAMDGF